MTNPPDLLGDGLDELHALLRDPALWVEPPAGLTDSVARAAAAAGRLPTRVPAASPAPRSRRLPWLLAAAAALVLIAGAAAVLTRRDDGGGDTVEFALSASELAPGATGRVRITAEQSGLRIELDAIGLPRRDNGEFYEAWLRNAKGELVPIGTFHEGTNVILWAGVSLADFPTVTITQETTDNNQASSGRRVLAGTAPTAGG